MRNPVKMWLLILALFTASCNDRLDIRQDYGFDLETMPVPKRIKAGETIEIRCRIVSEGNYKDARYYIRYFQPDGQGRLTLDNVVLIPNDLYRLRDRVFRLYYTAAGSDQQSIDVYIQDGFGKTVQKSFGFTGETENE